MISLCFAHCTVCGSADVQDEPCDACGYDYCTEHAEHGCDMAYGIGAEDARAALVAVLTARCEQVYLESPAYKRTLHYQYYVVLGDAVRQLGQAIVRVLQLGDIVRWLHQRMGVQHE